MVSFLSYTYNWLFKADMFAYIHLEGFRYNVLTFHSGTMLSIFFPCGLQVCKPYIMLGLIFNLRMGFHICMCGQCPVRFSDTFSFSFLLAREQGLPQKDRR